VKYNSFRVIPRSDKGDDYLRERFNINIGGGALPDVEIGFEAVVYSGFSEDCYYLRVFKIGKAYLELIGQ